MKVQSFFCPEETEKRGKSLAGKGGNGYEKLFRRCKQTVSHSGGTVQRNHLAVLRVYQTHHIKDALQPP